MRDRILVVDDEPAHTEFLSRYLGRCGFDVISTNEGADALRLVRESTPDLVMLDVVMPGMDGLSVCRNLRNHIPSQSMPVIFLTAKADLNDCLQGFEAGGDDYLVKPCDIQEIKARVESVLRRRRRDLWCHPLTQLPGSPSIEEEVRNRLKHNRPFAFAYVDIDHFKEYNDAYGYDAGDRVIKDLSRMLMGCSIGAPDVEPYPAHVGGDDFVFMATIDGLKEVLPVLTTAFDGRRIRYYRPEDFERGTIALRNRRGDLQNVPLITLSVAVVSTQTRCLQRYARLVGIASELKSYLKSLDHKGQSLIMWDRRSDFSPMERKSSS
jgi:DNA-binding response OmpR family regulator